MPGAMAYAHSNAADVIKALDPNGIMSKPGSPAAAVSGSIPGKITAQQMLPLTVAQESGGKYTAVNKDTGALGKYQIMPATGKNLAAQLGMPWQPELMKKDTPEARAYQDKLGLAAIQSSVDAAGGDPQAAFSHYYSGRTDAYAKPGNPKTAQYVQDMMGRLQKASPQMAVASPPPGTADLSATQPTSTYNPKGYTALTPPMTQINPDTGEVISQPASQLAAKQNTDKTGIPILDVLNGQQRLQVLSEAMNAKNQRDANARAEAQIQHENVIAAYKTTGAYAGQRMTEQVYVNAGFLPAQAHQMVGQEDAMAAAGPLINGMTTMNTSAMQARVTALKPTDTTSKTFEVDQQVYTAANEAMQQNLKQRQDHPAEYVQQAFPKITAQLAAAKNPGQTYAAYRAMANAYQQLGIPRSQWSPVTDDQAAAIGNQYLNANPATRLGMLNQWFHGVPPEMIQPFVAALVKATPKVGPSAGRDSFLYATLTGHPEFNNVMRDAMAGAEAQVDSARRIQTDKADAAWRTGLGAAGTALNATAAENYKKIAMDLYVNAGGAVPQGAGGQLDQSLWKESVRRAVGGLAGNKDTGYATVGGGLAPTILPPSVTKQQFQGWIDHLNPHTLSVASGGNGAYDKFGKAAYIRDIQDHGTFIMRAPGQYAIQFPDGGTLLNGRGGEYILRLRPEMFK